MIMSANEVALKSLRAIECDDLDVIYSLKDSLLKYYEELKNKDIYISLVKSCFFKQKFDEVIKLTEDLFEKNYERYEIFYYLILACLAENDIFRALSFLRKYRIMNQNGIKDLWNHEGTYSTALNYSLDIQKAVIMTRFLNELHDIDGMESGQGDPLVVRIYELINILNEIGFGIELIKELTDIANMISYEI